MAPVERFTFTNNVVANCKYFWVRPDKSTPKYRFSNSIIAGNEHYLGYYTSNGLVETSDNRNVVEDNVQKKGKLSLVIRTGPEFPVDYLHLSKESAGQELKAGVLGK